jgi:hypothetical protein
MIFAILPSSFEKTLNSSFSLSPIASLNFGEFSFWAPCIFCSLIPFIWTHKMGNMFLLPIVFQHLR